MGNPVAPKNRSHLHCSDCITLTPIPLGFENIFFKPIHSLAFTSTLMLLVVLG
jgi:hypothetical protein